VSDVGGLIVPLILIAEVWAIVNVVESGASTGERVAWVVVVLLLPAIGLIAWLVVGPRALARA
jgi:hypothetical protein